MTREEVAAIQERVKTNSILSRGHQFSVAYINLRESLKSVEFLGRGQCEKKCWPSYWFEKTTLPGENIRVECVKDMMRVSIKKL